MNILYCGDANVCRGIFLSAVSLSEHTDRPLVIYILTAATGTHTAIAPDFAEQLQEALCRRNRDSRVLLFDISEIFGACLPTANMDTRFTPLCMLRLFADLVPQIPDRILYLDADVLCRGDFTGLFDLDLSQAELAGVPDRYGKWFFGNILRHDYLNSGVLLLNMKNIRERGLFEKCRQLCREKKMFMPDQTALNQLAVKQKLPGRYNAQGTIRKTTVFKHFTTFFKFFPYFRAVTVKPWEKERMHKELHIFEFDHILDEYQRSIPV